MSEEEMLIDREEYLSNGVHIGTKAKHKDMEKYVFHVKKNQLAILDLDQTDQRIREIADFLSEYEPGEILVVGRKEAAHKAIENFSQAVGTEVISGRFMPGTLTNPQSDSFREPEVVLVTDPEEDAQAIDEAVDSKIPVVSIVDSADSLENIDLALPANNKSENALGIVMYLLAREIANNKGEEFEYQKADFLPETEEEDEE